MPNLTLLTTLSITKTCIGSGLLFYPIYFHVLGVYNCLLCIVVSSLFSLIGLFLYTKANSIYGKSLYGQIFTHKQNKIYKRKHRKFYKLLQGIADAVLIIKTIIVSIGYFIVLHQVLDSLFNNFMTNRIYINMSKYSVSVLICLFLVFILSQEKLKYLKMLSTFGMVCVLFFLVISVYYFATINNTISNNTISIVNKNINNSKKSLILEKFSFFVYSFTCHQTILSIHNSVYVKGLGFIRTCIVLSILLSATLYSLFGYLVNSAFGHLLNNIDNSILLNKFNFIELLRLNKLFSAKLVDNIIFISCLLVYSLVLIGCIPLQLVETEKYFKLKLQSFITLANYNYFKYLPSTVLLMVCVVVSLSVNIGSLQLFVGATISNMMCFVVPAVYIYTRGYKYKNRNAYNGMALLCGGFSMFLLGIFGYFTVYKKILALIK